MTVEIPINVVCILLFTMGLLIGLITGSWCKAL